jgi:hypothetical protein
MKTADHLIHRLGLAPHPEGGFFREIYRSRLAIPSDALPPAYGGARSAGTSIYFLLKSGDFSSLHRLRSDEIWHYHAGDPAAVHMIHPDGRHETTILGADVDRGQAPQAVIPAGCWFGARVERVDGWILVGCTVSPGFDFADFELGRRAVLVARFPAHADLIASLTRS